MVTLYNLTLVRFFSAENIPLGLLSMIEKMLQITPRQLIDSEANLELSPSSIHPLVFSDISLW